MDDANKENSQLDNCAFQTELLITSQKNKNDISRSLEGSKRYSASDCPVAAFEHEPFRELHNPIYREEILCSAPFSAAPNPELQVQEGLETVTVSITVMGDGIAETIAAHQKDINFKQKTHHPDDLLAELSRHSGQLKGRIAKVCVFLNKLR